MLSQLNLSVSNIKLKKLLITDLKIAESTINKYLDEITLNIILKTLPNEDRLQFYNLSEKDTVLAKEFINAKIPNLEELLVQRVQEDLGTNQ
ncbi:MAG: hypothetical protein ACD_57C00399G0003 [uncultured bacterium]|uniref:Uncharacterized protein n=1 Tax=Candidatus Woesebacteria bacterium RIFCSPLOWO2_01_FULL_39_21 TaxID=1802519 RepID=A0A1F8BEP7_9BACT|nr:MAG: hypothetical protein ACD_57C00399G0003 [uncultured bacterium]OGM22127.1 MAG: hypothetical protein A2691_03515 [Candidatus Woesebacteria bacterium RIFCSPHIGHO2_01_FULL_39_23]OGM62129.1 MAG: hypothetical protein A2961_05140 [Candidatus Woesebacteria bacterium RIFCSPLOWO2_01_FULL_39_21]